MKKISELVSLENRSAIVTGGAGHIGLAACESLMELGAKVAIMDLYEEACNKRCYELNRRGYKEKAFSAPCDLSSSEKTKNAAFDAVDKMGGINILIHLAAFVGTTDFPGWAVPFEDQTIDAWNTAMNVNLTCAFTLAQALRPDLENSSGSSIIFFNSIYGIVGPVKDIYDGTDVAPPPAAYAASKGGLGQLARYLGTIFAPKIRVNCITAGGVLRGQSPSFHKRYVKRTPMKRMAREEDFKGAIAYLASDLSSYVTGENLIVDGGWTAW